MKIIRSAFSKFGSGSIGFCFGVALVGFSLSQHPVVSLIVTHEGNDVETRFAVICAMRQNAQVKCHQEQEPPDVLGNSNLSREIANETF